MKLARFKYFIFLSGNEDEKDFPRATGAVDGKIIRKVCIQIHALRRKKKRDEKRSAKKNTINLYDYFSIINHAIKTATTDLIK